MATTASGARADDVWRQGSVLSFSESVVVRTSLTIEPGVTATFSNGASLLVESGATLTIDGTETAPVRMGPTRDTDAWNGVTFLPGSTGAVRYLEVRGSRSTSVSIFDASPLLEHCSLGNSEDDGSLGLVLFTAVVVSGDSAHPTIRRCTIESVRGRSGTDAANGIDGLNGSTGANGVFFDKDGKPGGGASAGTDGANGLVGGSAFGIVVRDGASATVESNIIRGIVGGAGGRGGDGGDGGDGGAGGAGYGGTGPGDGGAGGPGGAGGHGGNGGNGGSAIAIFLDDPGSELLVAGNAIYGIQSGQGGAGGSGGTGGSGGDGGDGGDCTIGCLNAGIGGDGGAGPPGGNGGAAGTPGIARGVSLQFPSQALVAHVVNNSLALIVPGDPLPPSAGGLGGAPGLGGEGGVGWAHVPAGDDGEAGAQGSDGTAGAGAAAPIAIGVSAFGSGAHMETGNHVTSLAPQGQAPVAQFRAQSGATMSVGALCVAGHSVLAIGDVSFDEEILEADPLFVAPPLSLPVESECCTTKKGQTGCSDNACAANVCGVDASCCSSQWDQECVELAETLCPWLCGNPLATASLALEPTSPAIDRGDNVDVPSLLVADLAGNARITDGDGNGTPTVDLGAYEADAVACGPDITCDGVVGGADLAAVLGSWGPCPSPCSADLNGSGVVDGADLAIVLANWGG